MTFLQKAVYLQDKSEQNIGELDFWVYHQLLVQHDFSLKHH
jgi:hypothetical protein